MRHALAHDLVGYCQVCDEPLTTRDVLETGQARLCPECWDSNSKLSWKNTQATPLEAR